MGSGKIDTKPFEYVLDLMDKNQIRQTSLIDARLFEYATLTDRLQYANN